MDMKRQPYGDNPCKRNNGNCSHLCLLGENPRGYSCACPTGVKLVDNSTCASRPEQLLLIVQRNEICKISLDSPDYTYFVLPLSDIKHAIAIDFDPVDEMLYWTDEQAFAIRRAYLDGSGQQDVILTEVRDNRRSCSLSEIHNLQKSTLNLSGAISAGNESRRYRNRLGSSQFVLDGHRN